MGRVPCGTQGPDRSPPRKNVGLWRVRFKETSWGLWGLWRMFLLLTSKWNSRAWERGLPSAMHTFFFPPFPGFWQEGSALGGQQYARGLLMHPRALGRGGPEWGQRVRLTPVDFLGPGLTLS